MEKERRIKTISVISLIVAVLGLTVAFAVLSANLVINGTAKVDPGTWNIYFDKLSEANKKGGASVEGVATINDENKTRIEGINVTLTKPMDEVTYTVELKNDGDIDAEISSITGPEIKGDIANYIEFSARYADNKEITEGDILKGGVTENVTISIKFKKEVTELPKEDLNVTLSYEINYVQTDKDDEEVHKGEVPPIDYDSLEIGDEVTLGTEHFYVIKNDVDTLTLLAKYNLLVGYTCVKYDCELIPKDTEGYGKQSSTAKSGKWGEPNIGMIEFQPYDESFEEEWGYWSNGDHDHDTINPKYGSKYPAYVYDSNSNLYQYVEAYKSYLKDDLGYDIKDARLMKLEEALELGNMEYSTYQQIYFSDSAPVFLDSFNLNYWIGDAYNCSLVYGIEHAESFDYGDYRGYLTKDFPASSVHVFGLRPVIVLSKS